MCTVSFIARRHGYLLGMNRDEKLTRPAGLPPRIRRVDGQRVLCPSESGGGTWIALNESGNAFALINWYSVSAHVSNRPVSRGRVVVAVSGATDLEAAAAALRELPLAQINPFRLIAIFPKQRQIIEWRWNLRELAFRRHPWRDRQWISSGFDEPGAQRIRGQIFRIAQKQKTNRTTCWLRRLHRSHAPERGPFSTCMHRSDAVTVSYTEIACTTNRLRMCYHPGSPCDSATSKSTSIPIHV